MKGKVFILGTLLILLQILSCSTRVDVPDNRVFSVEDLSQKKVGVQIGNTAEAYVAEYGGDSAKIELERFKTLDEAIGALRRGELDAVLCDDVPASIFVGRHQSLRILDEPFKEEAYAGVVSKGSGGLLDTVNMALIQMRAMGIYDSIFQSHVGGEGTYHYKPDSLAGEASKMAPALKIATNADFPPYEFRTENGLGGIDIEIARYLADFMERPLEIIDMGFDSIIDAVREGKADIGLAAFSVTEERERLVSFTDTYAKSRVVVVVRSDESESILTRIKDTLFGI